MPANTHVVGFSVADAAADVIASISALNSYGKLASLTVTGTSGSDRLILTGSTIRATLKLDGHLAGVSKA